ncbi:hypothetical protein TorRG33x02_145620 [Trema orientale]|uniref:Uncharacterized protein n=1 Tax=Trema orientale TaxID=63057 RepID=A0A2P5EW10_TREOI|nr:hypothetical protein TorRG33x02_145620 [Trema orientale]
MLKTRAAPTKNKHWHHHSILGLLKLSVNVVVCTHNEKYEWCWSSRLVMIRAL